jgi:hypothetical protein
VLAGVCLIANRQHVGKVLHGYAAFFEFEFCCMVIVFGGI